MKTILNYCTFLFLLIFISSCGSSKVSLGVTLDRGDFLQRPKIINGGRPNQRSTDPEPESGRGAYIEYGWFKMKGNRGFGFDVNLHRNGYTDDGDGDGFTYQTLQAKYYYSLSLLEERSKILFSLGLGGGRSKEYSGGAPLAVANAGADMYPFEKRRFYIATKVNYFQGLDTKSSWGKKNFGLSLGLGFLIWK